MFFKSLSIVFITLFWTLSSDSYSCDSRKEDVLVQDGSPSKLTHECKKRGRLDEAVPNETVHDPIGLADLAQTIDVYLHGFAGAGLLEDFEPADPLPSESTKEAKRVKTVSFRETKEILTFDNPLFEDEDEKTWVRYTHSLEVEKAEKRSFSSLNLDEPLPRVPFPVGFSLEDEGCELDRTNPFHRRIKMLVFRDTTDARNARRVAQHNADLLKSKNDPYVFWDRKYNEAHDLAKNTHTEFQEALPQRERILKRIKEMQIQLDNVEDPQDEGYLDLEDDLEELDAQFLWYENKALEISYHLGQAQRFLKLVIAEESTKENPNVQRLKLVKCIENTLSCYWLLPSFSNEKIFHSLCSDFFKNIQSLIHLEEYGIAKGFLVDFNKDFFANIKALHTRVPSADHHHEDFGPCDLCEDLCPDCTEFVRNFKEAQELIVRHHNV